MENQLEYIQLFMDYESDDMPVIYFYEVDLDNHRYMLRKIEFFIDRTVDCDDNPYHEVIEILPVPTVEEFNAKIFGENFYACRISKNEFEEIWSTGEYSGSLIPDKLNK